MAFSFRAGTNWCHDFPKLARESGFYFNMHRSRVRVDWNRIKSEYDVKILDPNFVKLFRIAQLAVEYLLYCKQYLDHSVVILKDELRSKLEDNAKLKKDNLSLEETVKDLREKLRIIETKIGDSHGELHKCPHCTKTFISAIFVAAHIARRHPNLAEPNITSSPVHEQYRMETEKLHNEIKTLKERLNQTERVIRYESDKSLEGLRAEREERMRITKNELQTEDRERDIRLEEQHRRYQDEISSLKSMLFNEIQSLKQKDRNFTPMRNYEDEFSNNHIKELVRQQEKEIQRLRDQLQERLTPDVENVQDKLQAQEHYWTSKLQHLETRHREDIANLLSQLKLTQDTAHHIREEYEKKVDELEKLSKSQSQILSVQGEQLNNISREIQDAHRTQQGLDKAEKDRDQKFNKQRIRYSNSIRERKKSLIDTDVVLENLETPSSQDSQGKKVPRISRKQFLQDDSNLIKKYENSDMESGNDRSQRISDSVGRSRNIVEDLDLNSIRSSRHETVSQHSPNRISYREDIVETFRANDDKHQMHKHNRNTSLARLSNNGNNLKAEQISMKEYESKKEKLDRVPLEKSMQDEKKWKSSTSESSESRPESEEDSESEATESETNSESNSQSGSSEESFVGETLGKNCTNDAQERALLLPEVRENILGLFQSKLRDLGIDPEWNGIPRATYKQKMDIVKHHQSINAKKFTKYEQIKHKIVQELTQRLTIKKKKSKNIETSKKSPLNKLMNNVKTKAMNALNYQRDGRKNEDTRVPVLKSHINSTRETMSRQKGRLDLLPRKMKDTDIRNIEQQRVRDSSQSSRILENISSASDRGTVLTSRTKVMQSFRESPSKDGKPISRSYESVKEFLKESKNSKTPFELTGIKVTSTPNKHLVNMMQESYATNTDESDSKILGDEKARSLPVSPKGNKSVLKSATGSVGSLVKKKVIFDLEKEIPEKDEVRKKSLGKLFPEYDVEKRDIDEDEDWNISSISDEKDQTPLESSAKISEQRILLKSHQSEKIAQISKKIEEQLSLSRRKPVGAIEAMLSTKAKLEESKDNNQYLSSMNVASLILESPAVRSPGRFGNRNEKSAPQPAPRAGKSAESLSLTLENNKLSKSQDSDLESDIEELLQMD
ncbi:zinc finger protein Dzip1 isoform X2 [Cephus cinctus]|uniref:Zinc finger protein Dzip1 isoform X2 n=1 Tax=Cephus cinctus TaxID=211228 RepID=A0AAJ7W7Y4_CEPCN|nr:zinc finger protein Dzip1 isoform X2 [Cephus cinctus]